MGIAYNSSIATSGLIFCVDAGNPRCYPGSGTTCIDLSPNGFTGTLINGVGWSSQQGGYFTFDGSTQYINIPNSTILNPTQSMTVMAWVYPTTIRDNSSIMGKGTTTSGSGGYDLRIDAPPSPGPSVNLVKYFVIDQRVSFSFSANTWYHIAAVQGATTMTVYVNAANAGSITNSQAFQSSTASFKIGSGRDNLSWFPGRIAQAMVYSQTLTAAEITQNFNATRGRYGI